MSFKEELNDIELEKSAKEFQQIEKEILEMESQGNPIKISKGLDEKMLQMIREFESIELKKNKKKIFNKYNRIAAMIMICITATFAVVTINVDAFRIKVFDFITKDNGIYMDVNIVEKGNITPMVKEKFPKEWKNVFYPMALPQGYELVEAKSIESRNQLIFSVKGKEYVTTFKYNPIGEWDKAIDSQNSEIIETKVNDKDAICSSKEGRNILIWADSGYEFTLITNELKIEETVKVAESIAYIELE